MKETLILLAMLAAVMNAPADPSVIADIKEYEKRILVPFPSLKTEADRKTYETRSAQNSIRISQIKARVDPIVHGEFVKLLAGEFTPFARELLSDPGTAGYCQVVLLKLLRDATAEVQTTVFGKVFAATPEPLRGGLMLLFWEEFPKEAFAGEEIQHWLVDKINGGGLAGAYYFILTEESAKAVTETAVKDMARFPKTKESRGNWCQFPLLSAVFLASRGDGDALALLDSLLEQRNINDPFDTRYAVWVAAMSGNEKLIQKIRDIITTDKRTSWFAGVQISFAHDAAFVCSLTIESFPPFKYEEWYSEGSLAIPEGSVLPDKYPGDETKKRVHDWLRDNPTHKVKLEDPRVFFKWHFSNVIFEMLHPDDEEEGDD